MHKHKPWSHQVFCSYAMVHVLTYLHRKEQPKFQQLNKFFYTVQQRSFQNSFPVRTEKRRLHLFNQNYLITFCFNTLTKHKRTLKNSEQLWNHQSIELRGQIYVIGGTLAN